MKKQADASARLLESMAEQIKIPLMQIARLSELSRWRGSQFKQALKTIEETADSSLRFIDSYLLSNQLLQKQLTLELEPVSLSSVLNDIAHQLSGYAGRYDCELQLVIDGRFGPVMAHRQALEAALTSLGQSMIEARSQAEAGDRQVVLAAHRTRGGITAGVYGEVEGLEPNDFKRAAALHGLARQPFAGSSAGSGAGIFIADVILEGMATHLRPARHHKNNGLAATFLPSRQLQLV